MQSDSIIVCTLVFALISSVAPDSPSDPSVRCFVAAEAGLDAFCCCY